MTDAHAPGPLRRLTRRALPAAGLPAPRPLPERGIVHLGLGNFHRAHQAVYTAQALAAEDGPWGITGVANRSRGVVAGMAEQDGLYTVLTLGPDGTDGTVPAVHGPGLTAADRPDAVVAALGSAATRIVTLTVTEKGYTFRGDGSLDTSDPRVAADLAGRGEPRTALGLLVRGLQRRVRGHAAAVTVLSCDNLLGNGERTRELLTEFIANLPRAERDELEPWFASSVATPSCMVDRIVPATGAAHRELVAARFGLADAVPVPAEPYRMWVMEDRFAAGRPAWERAGAVFTEDVSGYETMKLRLLNGAHSLLAYLGLLGGHRSVDAAAADAVVGGAVRAAMHREVLPTVRLPDGVDGARYAEQLLERFGNAALGHRTAQVASDGSLKIPVRWAGTVRDRLAAGAVPRLLALGVAAWIRVLTVPDAYDAAALGAVADPAADGLRAAVAPARSAAETVAAVVRGGAVLPPEVAGHAGFTAAVAESLDTLARHGVPAAVREARGGA